MSYSVFVLLLDFLFAVAAAAAAAASGKMTNEYKEVTNNLFLLSELDSERSSISLV